MPEIPRKFLQIARSLRGPKGPTRVVAARCAGLLRDGRFEAGELGLAGDPDRDRLGRGGAASTTSIMVIANGDSPSTA